MSVTSRWKKKKALKNVPSLGFEPGLEPGISGLAAQELALQLARFKLQLLNCVCIRGGCTVYLMLLNSIYL